MSTTIPLRRKFLYAIGDVAVNVKNASMTRFPLFFYADVLLVPPAAVGLVLFLARAWDAITDPVMGYVSDTTRSRWGRRRRHVVLGALPLGVAPPPPPRAGGGAVPTSGWARCRWAPPSTCCALLPSPPAGRCSGICSAST